MTTKEKFAGLQQSMVDNLNSNAQISAYCSSVTNTTVASSPGAWYQPFMTNLASAQSHASLYLNNIGPNAWTTVPNTIVTYGQTYKTSMDYVQKILNDAGANDLTAGQIADIQAIFENLASTLTKLLGTPADTNLSANGAPPPKQLTIWGCKNDLTTFDNNITGDNKNLVTGQNGASVEVGLLEADEQTMNTDISTLNAEIGTYTQYILASEIGIGVSIFVAVVGIALAVPTAGVSLVATGVGIAGLGGAIAGTAVYSDRVKSAQNKVAADQKELTTDQQQVGQLQAIIQSITGLSTKNQAAQTALGSAVDLYTELISDTNNTLDDLNNADSNQVKGILETIDIQDSLTDWNNLVTLAQGILNSTLNPQMLTPPPPTVAATK